MNINRDYLIINDVKKSNVKLDNGSIFFYITDKNTQNIFVNLVINVSNNDLIQKYANIENAEDYTLTMNIVKPDNTYKIIEGKLHDKEKAIFEFNLNEDCCDKIGTYKCELLTKCTINDHEEITTSNKLTYKVKSSVLNDLDDIVEAPEYPLVIQLFDKLSDIEQYEEDRRANELARQLAEEQRQQRFNELDTNIEDKITSIDDKMVDVEERVSAKEQAVDKLITDTKADIDEYKVAKDAEIDEYKATKDTEINNAITAQDNKIDEAITNQNNKIDDAVANQNNKIDTAIAEQNNRIEIVENSDNTQNTRLDALEVKDITHETSITNIEAKNVEQDNRLDSIEAVNVSQDNRLDAIEIKNQQQDDRLLDVEKVNKRQDMDLKCLFAESKNNMIDVTEEGNSIYLQNSTVGYTLIDEIQGNTMVNCNKEPDKELILNGNINTSGDNTVTLTEGVDGGKVDVALEGNTMVNVCDQKDSVAITKSYTVETGNHVALQGEYDGKCRPVVTGNTLVNLMTTYKDESLIEYFHPDYNPDVANVSMLKPNTKYTLIYKARYQKEGDAGKVIILMSGDLNEGIATPSDLTTTYQQYVFTFTTLSTVNNFILRTNSSYFYIKDVVLLEGNYTNKPIPDYFEGLQSSFEDKVVTQEMVDNGEELAENLGKYKVDYVVTGKNKFNGVWELGGFYWQDGVENDSEQDRYRTGFIRINPSTNYALSYPGGYNPTHYFFYDKDKNFIGSVGEGAFNDKKSTHNAQYVRFLKMSTGWNDEDKRFMLEEGTEATSYEPYKEYKKTFYLNSPLLEGDTIEQQGNNVVHVHRYKKVVLDGSADEVWQYNEKYFHISGFSDRSNATNSPCISNIGCTVSHTVLDSQSGYGVNMSYGFRVNLPNINTQNNTLNEFKTYLQSNPITVAYQLATPIYEVISQNDTILCDSYVNGHLDVDSAVPIKKVTFDWWLYDNKYVYPSTDYIVQFEADNVGKIDEMYFNGGVAKKDIAVVKGLNKIILTTNSTMAEFSARLNIRGIGFNASNIVVTKATDQDFGYFEGMKSVGECEDLEVVSSNSDGTLSNTQTLTHEPLRAVGDIKDKYVLIDGKWYIERNCGVRAYQEGDIDNYITDKINTVYPLSTPTYEPIDYNPFIVYSDVTHITNNSTIPCNMTIKNTGYNCLLKPSTTYTVSSNLGLNTVTTPSVLSEDCLRFYDTDTSDVTTMKNVTVLEGDYTTGKPIPSHFSGIESAFEQEYDEEKGKYKVKIRVQNEDASKENYIEFYIDEPLRGIGNVKDKVYVKNDKVVVERNCDSLVLDGSDDEEWFRRNMTNEIHSIGFGISNIYGVSRNSYCNNFVYDCPNAIWQIDKEGHVLIDFIHFRIHRCKLQTQDVAGFKKWLQQNPTTVVYQLAEPTYEEVEYNDVKLFIESFKNSTLFYNSNIPVSSKLYYSYSVPLVDTVAQTEDISNQQDSMIIDLATQVAVLEMMTM